MNKGPKISIITACYNAEATIEQTIQSVLSQTYDNIEYIIVDGASTDGTMNIVNKYRNQIDVIISEPDKGIYDAFNKGAKEATGKYIHYLNADDYFYNRQVVLNIAHYIQSSKKEIGLVYGGVKILDEQTGFFYFCNEKRNLEALKNGKMIPHQAVFLNKEILVESNSFNDNYKIAADYDLMCKVFLKYEQFIEYTDLIVAVFREGGISSDLKNKKLLINEYSKIIKENFNNYVQLSYYPPTEKLLKLWLENAVLNYNGIFSRVNIKNKQVAIWGTGEIAILLSREAEKNGILVRSFIDNNIQKQNESIKNIPICSPMYLKENDQIDFIIFGFEGPHEMAVMSQIKELNIDIKILNWKDLVMGMGVISK